MEHTAEYLVTNVIQINPQFAKSKRLQDYENAKDKHAKAVQTLRDFEANAKRNPDADQDSVELTRHDLKRELAKAADELASIKKQFVYDRKNSAKENGRTLTARSRKKIIHRLHFLYRKWREKPNAAKMLWYTFTFTGWLDGRAYDPQKDDVVIAKQFQRLLDCLKRSYGLSNYLWVAEPQTGKRRQDNFGLPTNAIHFHCVLIQPNERFLHVQAVNWLWLSFLHDIGAKTISRDTLKMKEFETREIFGPRGFDRLDKNDDCNVLGIMASRGDKETYNAYKSVFKLAGSLLLNPVDAEIINNPRKLATYVAKYVTKNSTTNDKSDDDPDNLPPRPVYINPWGCTRELANINTRLALAVPSTDEKGRPIMVSVELSDYEAELTPHIYKTHIIRKQLSNGQMIDLDTQTFDGFPPDLSTNKRSDDLPDTAPKQGFRKIYSFVRMVLKESVFQLDYFKSLMAQFVAQPLTLFTEPIEKYIHAKVITLTDSSLS